MVQFSEDTDVEEIPEKEEPVQVAAVQEEPPKSIVQWQVDYNYKKEQERLKIPSDPIEW